LPWLVSLVAMVGVPTNHAYNSYTPTGLSGVGIFLVAGGNTGHGLKRRSLRWLSVVETRSRRVVPEWSRRAIPTHNGRGILSILPPLKMSGLKIDSQFESVRAIFWSYNSYRVILFMWPPIHSGAKRSAANSNVLCLMSNV
jgi:hypothetical protein